MYSEMEACLNVSGGKEVEAAEPENTLGELPLYVLGSSLLQVQAVCRFYAIPWRPKPITLSD